MKSISHSLNINGVVLPLSIILESRNGYRVSFTKKGINIRVSSTLPLTTQKKQVELCIQWVKNTLTKKPYLLQKYTTTNYTHGYELVLFDKTLTIHRHAKNRKTIAGRVKDNKLIIEHPKEMMDAIIEPKYISRILAKHYLPFFTQRVNYWAACFPINYNSLRLKHNSSNWGSCSTKGNINLSTRLLLCPLPAIDYVIVHELAHLVHSNHSNAFWQEVKRIMPDYKLQEKWLKTTGTTLSF